MCVFGGGGGVGFLSSAQNRFIENRDEDCRMLIRLISLIVCLQLGLKLTLLQKTVPLGSRGSRGHPHKARWRDRLQYSSEKVSLSRVQTVSLSRVQTVSLSRVQTVSLSRVHTMSVCHRLRKSQSPRHGLRQDLSVSHFSVSPSPFLSLSDPPPPPPPPPSLCL